MSIQGAGGHAHKMWVLAERRKDQAWLERERKIKRLMDLIKQAIRNQAEREKNAKKI